jgi:hypothetical protein
MAASIYNYDKLKEQTLKEFVDVIVQGINVRRGESSHKSQSKFKV